MKSIKSTTKFKALVIILNIIFGTIVIIPVLYCFNASMMGKSELYAWPPKFFPKSYNLINYKQALKLAPFNRFIWNSTLVSTLSMMGQLITGSLAAYAFSMFKFKGKNLIFLIMLSTMMIPGQAIIIANYLTISKWGINNSHLALILPNVATAFCIFNMRQAFLQLPMEIKEASLVDGCPHFKFFYKIALPLVKPSIGALGIYAFLQCWNSYLWPLLVTDSVKMRTVQIGLGMLQGAESTSFGPVMAGAMMVLIPSIAAFILGQKQLIEGLTSGAVKG